MSGPAVFPASTLEALVAALSTVGCSRAELEAAAGVDVGVLTDPAGWAPTEAWRRVWDAARETRPEPGLPARAGLAVPFGALGLVDYLTGSADTVQGGLETLIGRFSGIASAFSFELDADAGVLSLIREEATHPDNPEFSVALMVSRLRELSGGQVRVLEVQLRAPAPVRPPQAELLGCAVRFEARVSGLTVPPEDLALPSLAADPRLYATLEALADRLDIGPNGPHFEAAVRARVRARLAGGGDIPAAGVAQTLGMSERTLGRRLADVGTSFRAVVEAVREAEAERLLLSGRSMADVAFGVGYAEQSAFARAFRRWKGCAPRAWLRARAEGAG